MKLCHVMCHKAGIITYIQLLGDTVALKFGRAKMCKIWCNLRQLLTLTTNISGTSQDIENGKQTLLKAIPAALDKKLVNFGPLTKKL